jgi:flagellar basal-body rod protein FlgF
VQGDGGPISIPPDNEITVAKDGTVSVVPSSGSQNAVSAIGRVKLVDPPETDLERGADGLFRLRGGGTAEASDRVALASGHLEGSNVNIVEQMVSMISLARQFEMQLRMLQTAEQNDRSAAQLLANR